MPEAQGEGQSVAQAIYEHYKPLSMEDSIPSTARRPDSGVGRQTRHAARLLQGGLDPQRVERSVRAAPRRARRGEDPGRSEARATRSISWRKANCAAFLLDRIQYYFREIRGFKYDEVNAVLASGCGTLADVEARLAALAAVRPTENFEPLAASFKRIRNIFKQAGVEPPRIRGSSAARSWTGGRPLCCFRRRSVSRLSGAGYRRDAGCGCHVASESRCVFRQSTGERARTPASARTGSLCCTNC